MRNVNKATPFLKGVMDPLKLCITGVMEKFV